MNDSKKKTVADQILERCGIPSDFEWTEEYRIPIPDVESGPSVSITELMDEDE